VARRGVTNCLDMSHEEEIQPDHDCYGQNWRIAGMEVGHEGPRFAMLTPFREPADQQGPMRESW
jgi:hypothetical protein